MAVTQTCRSMVMILISSALVYSSKERIAVGRNTCGHTVNLDVSEGVTLYLPSGQTPALDECKFEFTSENFDHDTCFKLNSVLNCPMTIQYRTFSRSIEKTIKCGDTDSDTLQEYCDIYGSMSVVFIIDYDFYLNRDITVEVYRKSDDDYNVSHAFSSYIIVLVIVGCAIVVILIIVCIAVKVICLKRRQNRDALHRPQPMPAQCVPLVSYPTQPSAPPSQVDFNSTPQSYRHGYQPHGHLAQGYGQRYPPSHLESQPSQHGHQQPQHGYQQPQQGYQQQGHQQPQQGYQPERSSLGHQAEEGHVQDSAAPPPAYEEAKYFPASSKQTVAEAGGDDEDLLAEIKPGSEKIPDPPPPPYPGV